MDSIYFGYQNRNQDLVNYLEKLYQDQLKLYQELDQLVTDKVKTLFEKEKAETAEIYQRELEEFNLLEKQRVTFQIEEERLEKEIKHLEKEEEELENLKIHQLSLSTEIDSEIEVLKEENQSLLKKLKSSQKEKQNLQHEKRELNDKYNQSIRQLKTHQKGDLLALEERQNYLLDKKRALDSDYNDFQDKWDLYLEKVDDKREEISETISILEEELKNKNLRQQLERRKAAQKNRAWLEEVKRNKKQIKTWLTENQKVEIDIQIIKEHQSEWLLNKKREFQIEIDEKQADAQDLEHQIKETKKEMTNLGSLISDLEDKVQNGRKDLEGSIKHHRLSLSQLLQKKMTLEDKYNLSLLDLNRLQKNCQEEINSDPFKDELRILETRIERNLLSIQKIKKREAIAVQRNKAYLKEMREHLSNLRNDIKKNYAELEKVNKMASNQETRHQEEDQLYKEKYDKYYQSLNHQTEYQEGILEQHQKDLEKIQTELDADLETVDFSLWDCQDEIDNTRQKSSQTLQKVDQLEYKRNHLGKKEDLTQKEVRMKKKDLEKEKLKLGNLQILWQSDLSAYQDKLKELEEDKQDFQVKTLEKVQDLFKVRNEAEKELRSLQGELEIVKYDLKKSFDERVNLQRKINQEIQNQKIEFSSEINSEINL